MRTKFEFEIPFAWTWLNLKTCCITSNVTSARTELVCGSLFQPVNDCVAWRIEKYALKNTPRMNRLVHGKFYEGNARCMQGASTPCMWGVDAGMHVICSLHTIVCRLHASVVWTRLYMYFHFIFSMFGAVVALYYCAVNKKNSNVFPDLDNGNVLQYVRISLLSVLSFGLF